ncbi:hypothetical protein MUN82_15580 [Hymenobacter aerilatus]|uniref:Uncharacterized protein n=1 Tax=Hymenobacter aerilatus TaxID=2932251 RepID=A0A8T9SX36_9BACT|nr:hypothetical protein [Hymenobacter aerilatus]UOR04356.1 hypothetical protein MUN82_15580 [Hymenobacter aerilatus]
MAEINIQRKKSSPSPWLIVILVALALAVAGYFVFRNDTAETPPLPPVVSDGASTPTDLNASKAMPAADGQAVADMAAADELPPTPEELEAYAATDPAQPEYAREGLRRFTATLVRMADRAEFRDPNVNEQRDQLTSATARIDEEGTSLRPGFLAVASLLKAMQQKAYPNEEFAANDLSLQASQFSGRTGTVQEREWVQNFFRHAAQLMKTMGGPTS